jgi:hexosaminidase
MTPTEYAYLNFGQGDPAYEPISFPEFISLEHVYSFDPVPKELTPEEAKYVIGGQGNLWTEYIASPDAAEYQLFPRMLAIAEDVWTRPENKNYADFLRRLSAQYPRLDKENVNYRIPEPEGLRNIVLGNDLNTTVELTPAVDGAKIYYTTDGSAPSESSTLYNKPIELSLKQGDRVDLKTIEVLPNGRKSYVYAATILGRNYLSATDLAEKRQGVTYAFSANGTIASGETRGLGFQQFAKFGDLKQPFAASFDGFLNVAADGIYEFQTDAIWDTAIYVDGEKVIDSRGTKDRAVTSGVIPLRAGHHRISLRYNHHGGDPVFRVRWGVKGQGLRGLGDLVH